MHTHLYATLQLINHLPPPICFTHAQPRPRRDVAAAQPDKGRDKAEAAGAGPSSWEVPAKQLSACQTASQAMQQVRLALECDIHLLHLSLTQQFRSIRLSCHVQLTGNAPGGMWVTHPTAEQWRQIIAKVADSRSAQAQELQVGGCKSFYRAFGMPPLLYIWPNFKRAHFERTERRRCRGWTYRSRSWRGSGSTSSRRPWKTTRSACLYTRTGAPTCSTVGLVV